jgi:translation initiation factor IF-2
MDNPLIRKDLVESIVELRAEVERRLRQNQYYVALHKLDELLAAIRPLDIIEGEANPAPAAPEPQALAAAEPEAAAPARAAEAPAETVAEEMQASWQPASPSYGAEAQAGLSAAPAEATANGLDAA